MVTTRSRVNKQATAASNGNVITTSAAPTQQPLKRKNSTPSTVSPAPKVPKTDPVSDLDLAAELPAAPAPTPVTQVSQQQALHSADDTVAAVAADLATVTSPSKPAPAHAPALAAATAPPAMVVTPGASAPSTTAKLETLKEPTPESAPLPEVATVLEGSGPSTTAATTKPTALHSNPIANNTTTATQPPAPTAPQLSTIPAPTPAPVPVPELVSKTSAPTTSALGGVPAPVTTAAPTTAPLTSANAAGASTTLPRIPQHAALGNIAPPTIQPEAIGNATLKSATNGHHETTNTAPGLQPHQPQPGQQQNSGGGVGGQVSSVVAGIEKSSNTNLV